VEIVTEKTSFREAFARRQCLVPLDGFFEWLRRGDTKQPFYFHMRDGEPFAVAGLWEVWEGDGAPLETCTLLHYERERAARGLSRPDAGDTQAGGFRAPLAFGARAVH
jgi:putative SOS response-associated peptidase YedK